MNEFEYDAEKANTILHEAWHSQTSSLSRRGDTTYRSSSKTLVVRSCFSERFQRASKHFIWILPQIVIFGGFAIYYASTPNYSTIRSIAGAGFVFARSAAMSICVNCALLMIPVCFKIVSILERFSVFRKAGQLVPKMIAFHVHVAFTIVLMTVIHVGAHMWNFYQLAQLEGVDAIMLIFTTGTGFTGLVVTASLVLICITATLKRIRRANFEVFYFTHHLYILFFASLLTHGMFCFIKADGETQCRGPQFWKYVVFPLALYFVDRVMREFGSKAIVQAAILHSSNVLELKFEVPSWKRKNTGYQTGIGSFVRIKCPAVSRLQWHPFTLSNASKTDGSLSVHIHLDGDWTKKLSNVFESRVKMSKEMPKLVVSGPYPGMMKSIDKWPVAVVIGGGIGVTPTASLLKSLMSESEFHTLKKVYVVWVCSEVSNFQCLQEHISQFEQNSSAVCEYEIMLYWTAKRASLGTIHYASLNFNNPTDALTAFKSRTYFGRPDICELLLKIHRQNVWGKIGVFTCGSRSLCDSVKKACVALDAGQVSIKCHEECF